MNPDILTVTNLIVAITCLVSFWVMDNQVLKSNLLFHPVTVKQSNQWYRFITAGFIHADGMHLLFNMFVLWSFGNALEAFYYPAFVGAGSTLKYVLLYMGGIIVASIPCYLRHQNNPSYAALGASGGVSAVVFAVIIFDPWQNLYLFGIIALPQILAGVAYLWYSWVMDKKAADNIGHMAHFAGAIWGFVFTGLLNPTLFLAFVQKTLAGPSWL